MVSGLVWKQYVDHQRETVLPTTDGLTREQTAPVLPPSTPTFSGLHNYPALVGTPDVHRDVARDSPPGRSPLGRWRQAGVMAWSGHGVGAWHNVAAGVVFELVPQRRRRTAPIHGGLRSHRGSAPAMRQAVP